MKPTIHLDDNEIPVNKIICVGQNYQKHIEEMRSQPAKDPVIFLKPSTSLTTEKIVILPSDCGSIHYEVELVALIAHKGKNLSLEDTMGYIAGYAVGLDLTLRDIQTTAKKAGLPWALAKGFDNSAPVGSFTSASQIKDIYNLNIKLHQNGILRQNSNTSRMIYKLDYLLSYTSRFITLEPGDLFFTGTPEGVGPVHNNDSLIGDIDHLATLEIQIKK